MKMNLTTKEKKWLTELQKHLDSAPASLRKKASDRKVCSYTIGDRNVTVYDEEKLTKWKEENRDRAHRDVCQMVDESDSLLLVLTFPFDVESTAG